MTSSIHMLRAERLHEYLLALPGDDLPAMRVIGEALNFPPAQGAYMVCEAFERLAVDGRVQERHGSRAQNRGHRIIRLRNGRVLKTAGCPLTLDDSLANGRTK
jgi:hypothetical protein